MTFWAGVKYALNSRLGTPDMKPLDQIIEGQRSLAASDSTIAVLSSTTVSGGVADSPKYLGSFTTNKDGSVRIMAEVSNYDNLVETGRYASIISVVKDGREVLKLSVATTRDFEYVKIYGDISVKPGDSFDVYFYRTGASGQCKYCKVGANIVDTSAVTVTGGGV